MTGPGHPPAGAGPAEGELLALCDACHNPVADGRGEVWVTARELADHHRAMHHWERQNPGPARTVGAILAQPPAVRWHVTHHHAACAGLLPADAHAFGVEHCRTWAGLADRTRLLAGHDWLADTDWDTLLDDARNGAGRRITPAPGHHAP
ncbi:hypothetical protein AB0D08_38315 [Kitasatospora sp. NPDC048540]|uniref:hypothetical protein n=1 Tax=Kitasatospora sp. NPDC048540 TaxID=3155634 RepID=UPI0033F5ECA2